MLRIFSSESEYSIISDAAIRETKAATRGKALQYTAAVFTKRIRCDTRDEPLPTNKPNSQCVTGCPADAFH